jgi:hypothetical protein
MAVTDTNEDVLSPEEIDEQRRARLAALAAPSRLGPIGDVRPLPAAAAKHVDAVAPKLTPAGGDSLDRGDLSEAPRLTRAGSSDAPDGNLSDTRLKPLTFAERQRLPVIGSGVQAGSQGQYRSEIARDEDQKQNPWGSKENHPGALGRLAHIAARVGNIAGDIVAPDTMALIQGTDLNNRLKESNSKQNLEVQQQRDLGEETEQNRAKHEQNVQASDDLKYKQNQEKIDETKHKDDNTYATGLRKQGYELGPDGKPVPLTYENMSPVEQAHFDLSTSTQELKAAQADFEKTKADPNSVQNKAAHQRVLTAIQNASTAAQRLGLSKDEFRAKYLGLDPEGNQLAGTTTDQNTGKPIGPSVANSGSQALAHFNKDYVKPSEDTERSYQMYQEAMKAYNSGDTKTGAATMMALAQHIGTTFGQTKGSRQTRDLIQDHKDAIGVMDKIERYGNHLVRGDELSASQMKEFGDLISNFRKLSWQTAVKEGHRSNQQIDFLPADLQKEFGSTTQQKPNAAQPQRSSFKVPDGAPQAPSADGHKLKVNGQVVAISKGGQWQQPTP